MFEKLISNSIRHRLLVLIAMCVLVVAGIRSFQRLPIDAIPDLTNVQVQVLTSAPALAPLDIERLITAPVEFSLGGLPRVQEIRSVSRYGVSAVTVVFEDGCDPYLARQLVSERLPRARQAISSEYGSPELGPMSTGLGEIYQFEVKGEGRTPMELRSILDWQIAPRLRLIPGIVDVNTFGGELKTYEVAVNPERLLATNVSLQDLVNALTHNNRATGGGSIARGAEGLLVGGDALITSLDDLSEILVAIHDNVPVYVGQLGTVRFAPMLRQGATTRDGRGEIVAGMTMMLFGENSREVAHDVQTTVDRINATLPTGVAIEPFYNRTVLVERTLNTVATNLSEGGALVVVILFLMLRNLSAGLIAAAMIPLAMMAAFVGMHAAGVSGNLMSLGAIDFGLVVDGAIVLLENAVHHLIAEQEEKRRPLSRPERDAIVLRSALEVRSATAFGEAIIAVVYLPILTLEGVEGKMFRPMALTVIFALAGAFLLSLTVVPALASLLLTTRSRPHQYRALSGLRCLYEYALRTTVRQPTRTLAVAIVVCCASLGLGTRLGSEFIPTLDEGAIIIETNRLPSTSLEESVRQGSIIERVLLRFPEVQTVVVKTGRPEIASDPMGIEQSDVYVILKDREHWSGNHDREALITRMKHALTAALPSAAFGFAQPIAMRMNELVSGVRSDFAVKIYGDDLSTLAWLGERVAHRLRQVRGAEDIKADRVEGLPVFRARIRREEAARRGVSSSDVLDAVASIGGIAAGEVLEERRRYALRVRLAPELRGDIEAISRFPIRTAGAAFAPLGDVADLAIVDEPLIINREALARRLVVQANVRGRDLGGFADEAQAALSEDITLPPGYYLEWGGQFENLRRARARLMVVVPLALLLIFGLLYATFRSIRPAMLILLNVPFAAVGGIVALCIRQLPFSISAGVGFVALFGIAVLNGLILVSQIQSSQPGHRSIEEAVYHGTIRRLRPVLTTALVASLGFVPMALASGAGAEVQRPLATVVIGGLISSTLLTLFVLPSMYARFMRGKCTPPETLETA